LSSAIVVSSIPRMPPMPDPTISADAFGVRFGDLQPESSSAIIDAATP
jgi:hypothetical protein